MQSRLGVSTPKRKKKSTKHPSSSLKTNRGGSKDAKPIEDTSGQMVLYDLVGSNTSQDIVAVNDPRNNYDIVDISIHSSSLFSSTKGLPSVGAFTVQCSICFKWRLVPSKEKYEEIRETISRKPFICDRAGEWQANVSCDDPSDIDQDGSKLWAMDKPDIAQPPPGWERLLRIRGEGGTRFADIYYIAPSGKRLRSMVEVKKYLDQHPEYIRDGVNLTQFSFLTPKPLQEGYVRNRHAHSAIKVGTTNYMLEPLETNEVNPALCAPPTRQELQYGGQEFSIYPHESVSYPPTNGRPAKMKPVRRITSKISGLPTNDHSELGPDDAHGSADSSQYEPEPLR